MKQKEIKEIAVERKELFSAYAGFIFGIPIMVFLLKWIPIWFPVFA